MNVFNQQFLVAEFNVCRLSAAKGAPADLQFEVILETLSEEFCGDFPTSCGGLFEGSPGEFFFTPAYAHNVQKYMQVAVRTDDVWVDTFAKCGEFILEELLRL